MELVSVIIPIYNTAAYLNRCVDSIMTQTYSNFELILVDDGSQDNSGLICDKYASIDKRVKVIHTENKGQSLARRTGINTSKGEYLIFCDSDDFLRDNCIEVLLNVSRKYDSDIVQCEFETGNSDYFSKPYNSAFRTKVLNTKTALNSTQYKVSFGGKLFKKELFNNINIPNYAKYEDDAAYYRIAYNAKKILISNAVLYYYFQTDTSIMRGHTPQFDPIITAIYTERIHFFESAEDAKLISGSHARFCLVLLLYFINLSRTDITFKVKQELRKLFLEHYQHTRAFHACEVKLHIAFFVFRYFPSLFTYLIIRLS